MLDKHPYLRWLARPVELTLLQIPKALAASCLGAVLDMGILVLLVEVFHCPKMVAATVSYLLPCVLGYFIFLYWIFPGQSQKLSTGMLMFLVLSLGGLLITWSAMGLLHETLGVNYVQAKIVSFVTAFSWNFLSRKFWVFRTAPAPETAAAPVAA